MNEKLKHTPGPWKFQDLDEYTIGIISPWSDILKPGNSDGYGDYRGIRVTEIKHQNDNPCVSKKQAEANARLIATAPEMLEALIKKVKTGYRNGKPVYDGEIRDIIEKATGLKIEEIIN